MWNIYLRGVPVIKAKRRCLFTITWFVWRNNLISVSSRLCVHFDSAYDPARPLRTRRSYEQKPSAPRDTVNSDGFFVGAGRCGLPGRADAAGFHLRSRERSKRQCDPGRESDSDGYRTRRIVSNAYQPDRVLPNPRVDTQHLPDYSREARISQIPARYFPA